MKTVLNLFIIFLFLLFISCEEKMSTSGDNMNSLQIEKGDYLIFGVYYGFCVGEQCVKNFKMTAGKLYEDQADSYAGGSPFDFVELTNSQYKKVKDLPDSFPLELMDEKDSIFGCPDCADQGGIYLEYSNDGVKKIWKIDQFRENVPDYLHDFMDKVNQAVVLINS